MVHHHITQTSHSWQNVSSKLSHHHVRMSFAFFFQFVDLLCHPLQDISYGISNQVIHADNEEEKKSHRLPPCLCFAPLCKSFVKPKSQWKEGLCHTNMSPTFKWSDPWKQQRRKSWMHYLQETWDSTRRRRCSPTVFGSSCSKWTDQCHSSGLLSFRLWLIWSTCRLAH